MSKRRVVITGLGAVTPLGLTAPDSWRAARAGVCGIGPITQYDAAGKKVTLAAEVKGFEPERYFSRMEARHMGRFTQFALAAAKEALADSGVCLEEQELDRCGVIVSSGIGGQAITESECLKGAEQNWDRVSPYYIPTAICNMAAGQIAIHAGFRVRSSQPRGDQRRGRRLPVHPGRLWGLYALRRHGVQHHPPLRRRLYVHEGPQPGCGSQPGLHPL